MKLRDQILAQADEINAIAARYGATNLRLFGSVARGDDRPDSDIDILATIDAQNYSLWDVMDLEEQLEKIFTRKIQVTSDFDLPPRFSTRISDDLVTLEVSHANTAI